MKNLFNFIFLVSLSFQASASFVKTEWIEGEHTKVVLNSENQIEYPMVRLENKGTPVILLHGFSANLHSWMDLAPDLYNAGYDVWSFSWSVNDDRDIQNSGEKTVKEIVDYVVKKTNKRPILVGHSLGGVISKIYSYGIQLDPITNTPVINPVRVAEAKAKIKGLVAVTSPNGEGMEKLLIYQPMFKLISASPISFESKDLSEVIKSEKLRREYYIVSNLEYAAMASRLPGFRKIVDTLFNLDYQPVSERNVGKVMRFGLGHIPKAIKDEVLNFKSFPYTELFNNAPKVVPVAFISGEYDDLADYQTIQDEAKDAPLLMLEKAGHLDPLFGEKRIETSKFMLDFMKKL